MGLSVVYLTFLMKRGRRAAQEANRKLRDAKEKITRSMERIREVIELAPDAFFQSDLDARFTDVNQAACGLLGYDRDELIGKTIFDVIPDEDAARLKAVRPNFSCPDGRTEPSGPKGESGQLRRLKVTSADPGKAALCAVLEQMPRDRSLPHVIRSAIES